MRLSSLMTNSVFKNQHVDNSQKKDKGLRQSPNLIFET